MVYDFKFPDVGEGITEGEIHKWRVKEGDRVKEHDIIADIETDKAIVEMPSPKSGTVLTLHLKEGDTVKVGEVLVTIGEEGKKVSETDRLAEALKPQKAVSVVGTLEEAPTEEEIPTRVTSIKQTREQTGVLATPVVRTLAKGMDVDINKVKGSGAGGRVTEEDVKSFFDNGANVAQPPVPSQIESVEAPKIVKKYDMYGYIERVPLKSVRKSIAVHLVEGVRRAALVTGMDIADVTSLYEHREREKESAEAKGIKLTYLPFVIKAVVAALKEYPNLNSSIDDENGEIILKKYYNIGIAVQTNVGLMVPIIKNVEEKTVFDLAREIKDLTDRAKIRTIDMADLKGGTFSITNYGSVGGMFATPLPNFPESAILGLGKIRDVPMVNKGSLQIRKGLPLSLTFDHRVTDGAEASQFTNTVIKRLEDPDSILFGD